MLRRSQFLDRRLVEEMAKFPAVSKLIRPSSYRLDRCWPPGLPADRISQAIVTFEWNGHARSNWLDVVATRQHLGGQRWWWRCKSCGRRTGTLLSPMNAEPEWACRRCWHAYYTSQYPPSIKLRLLAYGLGIGPGNVAELDRRFTFLNARRRRDVRRGRRVHLRALRALIRILRWERQVGVTLGLA